LLAALEEAGTELAKIKEIVAKAKRTHTWPEPPPAPSGPRDVWILSSKDGVETTEGSSFEAVVREKPHVLGVNLSALQRVLWQRLARRAERRPTTKQRQR
jgi:hypothetical protein